MSDAGILGTVIDVVRSAGKVPDTKLVTAETRLVEDLGIDSLDLVAVFIGVQDRFEIVIDDELVPSLKRVCDLVAQVKAQKETGVAAA